MRFLSDVTFDNRRSHRPESRLRTADKVGILTGRLWLGTHENSVPPTFRLIVRFPPSMQFLAPSRTPCRAVRTSMRRGVLFDDRIADAAKISPQSPSKESQEPCTLDLHNAKQWNCSGDPCFFSVHVWAGDQVRVIMMDSNVANLGQARPGQARPDRLINGRPEGLPV